MPKSIRGLTITDLILGQGLLAEQGKVVIIHYRGFLNHGEQFRSSYDTGQPLSFRIGARQVIAGLEKGVIGMRVGGKRKIRVSPHLAYRDQSVPGIPPNAVLIFEIDLIEIQD
ncbi:MAG TPA: FKBP-type peptidyl-prolyl cis-trans isomerase [Ktedonobacteraceae bacterium]|nr:FKBP-type peptidyl-prolyl cis-trans isomerase [Ktedonobacteraceae bacterium]